MIGTRINISRTEILSANVQPSERTSIHLNEEALQYVEEFKYLQAKFIATGQDKDEISAACKIDFDLALKSNYQSNVESVRPVSKQDCSLVLRVAGKFVQKT